jgi:putative alpha-1,2-mannosidase
MSNFFTRLSAALPVFLSILVKTLYAQSADPLLYVDPFIGTANSDVLTKWGSEGGTFPGAVAPFGTVQLTPETSIADKKGYYYQDSTLCFFSCTLHKSGYPNGSAGRLRVMPVSDAAQVSLPRPGRPFRHQQEKASPGYYSVFLKDNNTLIEATVTERCGMFRFTFPSGIVPMIFIGDMGAITLRSNRVVEGEGRIFNALLHFSEDARSAQAVDSSGYVLSFSPSVSGATVIMLTLSVSGVGIESAQQNIDAEIGPLGFDQVHERTRRQWQHELSVVNIDDTDTQAKTIFYTALYHSLLLPWIISDVDGRYRGRDGVIHRTTGRYEYGGFSPWDTYRTLHPLMSLLSPARQNDMVLSMLDIVDHTGYLPVDPMTGNHAVPVIVDSYLKGIRGFDSTRAYTAMKKSIDVPPFLQHDLEAYQQEGYLSSSYAESVTRTVEYAYDDWALARFAGTVMHQHGDYDRLIRRGYSYRRLFSPQALFLLPRKGSEFKLQPGTFGYKEGDPWAYTYAVPHQVTDLINLMGGKDVFTSRLDSALTYGKIIFDNETVFHIPYLFNYAGHPEKTQQWVREIMRQRYNNTPGGIPGNDDLGSMSSWYVLSAMGIFPVSPGNPVYDISTPVFKSLTLHLASGKDFTIKNKNPSAQHVYIKSLLVNKKKHRQRQIAHARILEGGEMVFETDRKPGHWFLAEATGAPAFTIHDHSVSTQKVKPNEIFWVRFSVSNKGSLGTRTVRLWGNGKEYGRRNCLVDSNSTITDSISCRLYALGKVQLKIDKLKELEVEVIDPGLPISEQVSVEEVSLKPVLKQGDVLRVAYTVQNIGWIAHTFQIPVFLDDAPLQTESVRLNPGERKAVVLELKIPAKGFHTIRVQNKTERIKVYDRNTEALIVDLSLRNTGGTSVIDSSGFDNRGKIAETDTGLNDHKGDYIGLGKDRFVELSASTSLNVMSETITMMAWVYDASTGRGQSDLLTKGDHHVLQTYGRYGINFFVGGWGRGECSAPLPENWLNHWHHVAGVCDGTTLRLYIDGVLKGTTALEAPVNLSVPSNWNIGRNEEFPSERIFTGYMDKIKIFAAPLSAAEIESIVKKEASAVGKK